ncbi:PD-(D/E)XK nuclease family protein [Microvirga splendida]|uniref:PD-(D/E)XK nuclease family protein n=1 Tax=Microvirga splendida TaxID=2795727 RepID=A0ABS0Y0C7_9HYPH|nr:PD-(D/E)XK nuclease family protein [Microvirga splendida]MBJ6125390.1 PD-(D/E)XK nuclease family protein [Microvirga splendida]
MHIIFGMMADGSAYPDFPGDEDGILDGCVVGPLGLLTILETKLGLSGPPVTPVVRITAWQKKLQEACKGSSRFWSASLAADPFSTARLILSWRDALVEAGWHPGSIANPPERLSDMAAAEAALELMPLGRADRLRAVMRRLEAGGRVAIEKLETVEPIEHLPPGWRRLAELLAEGGTKVRQKAIQSPVEASSDLGRLHVFLKQGTLLPLEGDASVLMLKSASEISAAEAVAEWVACDMDGGTGHTVVIAQDGSTAMLDLVLARLSQPVLGVSSASPFRGALQVLTLAFATVWKPFDADRFLSLLTLPNPPMRRKPAGILARAVSSEPGIDGREWKRAWALIEEWALEKGEGDKRKTAKLLDGVKAWADAKQIARFDHSMPSNEAKEIADRVKTWAATLAGEDRDPLLMCVVGAAKALSEALNKLNESPVSKRQIEQMIDASIAEGLGNPEHRAEASRLRAIGTPGALCGPVKRVVWWNFAGHEPAAPPFPWYRSELAALEAVGCCPERPSEAARRQTSYWTNAALAASEGIMFVRPAVIAGEEVGSHPFAHLLAPLFDHEKRRNLIEAKAEAVQEYEVHQLAARTINRQAGTPRATPVQQVSWTVPAIPDLLAELVESPTSLETLASCHLKWLLKHVAKLDAGRIRGIPDSRRLIGNVAHAIAQEVFLPGPVPPGKDARRKAEAVFDRIVEQIAAPLLKAGGANDLISARQRIPKAMEILADILSADGWEIVGTEMEVIHDFGDGLRIKGYTDLRTTHAIHGTGVIDFKWTKSDTRRRREIKDGRAIQISAYSNAVEPGRTLPAAYFMLGQGTLLAEENSPLAGDPVRTDRNLADTWSAVAGMHRSWRDMTVSGVAASTGLDGAPMPDDLVLVPPKKSNPCEYCDYDGLCRVSQTA